MYWYSDDYKYIYNTDVFTFGSVYMSECEHYIYPEQCPFPVEPPLAGPEPPPVHWCEPPHGPNLWV
jgi:hypothetical protein